MWRVSEFLILFDIFVSLGGVSGKSARDPGARGILLLAREGWRGFVLKSRRTRSTLPTRALEKGSVWPAASFFLPSDAEFDSGESLYCWRRVFCVGAGIGAVGGFDSARGEGER